MFSNRESFQNGFEEKLVSLCKEYNKQKSSGRDYHAEYTLKEIEQLAKTPNIKNYISREAILEVRKLLGKDLFEKHVKNPILESNKEYNKNREMILNASFPRKLSDKLSVEELYYVQNYISDKLKYDMDFREQLLSAFEKDIKDSKSKGREYFKIFDDQEISKKNVMKELTPDLSLFKRTIATINKAVQVDENHKVARYLLNTEFFSYLKKQYNMKKEFGKMLIKRASDMGPKI